jgi:hypothetical protein
MWNYITPRPLRLLRSEKALADRAAGSLKSAANRIFLLERRKIFQVAGMLRFSGFQRSSN